MIKKMRVAAACGVLTAGMLTTAVVATAAGFLLWELTVRLADAVEGPQR